MWLWEGKSETQTLILDENIEHDEWLFGIGIKQMG